MVIQYLIICPGSFEYICIALLCTQYHVEEAGSAAVKIYNVTVPALEGIASSAGTGTDTDGARLAAIPSLRVPTTAAA